MNRQRFVLPALTVLTLMRLAMLPLRELSPLEAYSYMCSQRLDAWHAMMGPVLPVLIRLTTAVFGASELGVRFASPLLILGATVLLWKLARGFFDSNTASWSIVIFSALPEVNLASVTMTPMTVSIAGSVALLYVLRVALHRNHKWHLPWWTVAFTLLLLFFVDWHLLMFSAAAAAALVVTRRGRRAVLKWPVLPVLVGTLGLGLTVGFSWSSEHHWMPMATVTNPEGFSGNRLWAAALAHSIFITAAIGWGLFRSSVRKPLTYPVAYLYSFASPMLTLDALTFLSSPWPMSGYGGWLAPSCLLLAHQMTLWSPPQLKLKAWLRTGAIIICVLQSGMIMDTDVVRRAGNAWKLSPNENGKVSMLPADPSRDLMGWKTVAEQLDGILADASVQTGLLPYVVTDHWQTAACLSFYLQGRHAAQPSSKHPLVHLYTEDPSPNPFSMWPGTTGWEGPVVFVADAALTKGPPKELTKDRSMTHLSGWFDVTHQGLLVRTIKVFTCSAEITGKK